MNFYKYTNSTPEQIEQYVDERLLDRKHHPEFPLDIYTYGRTTVHEGHWDHITTKCRGIIVHRETGEIIARPFEKFFNLGSDEVPGCTSKDVEMMENAGAKPVIWEKVDGFLCTRYEWEGKQYMASKGSFNSVHAKWATAELNKLPNKCPKGYTAVFEGLTPNLRIVVDYPKEELVLLALINNETGVEIRGNELDWWGDEIGVRTPKRFWFSWQKAAKLALDPGIKNKEGFVLTWYSQHGPPVRLKVKMLDYLRLHRMVTCVSPKNILEVMENGWLSEMEDLLNNSTPWFKAFVEKWKRAFQLEFERLYNQADNAYKMVRADLQDKKFENMGEERKAYALRFAEYPETAHIMFAMLDGKQIAPIIWKKVKALKNNAGPLIDAHNL